jgi:glycosyltransferase involved in cell wall biosynthesis
MVTLSIVIPVYNEAETLPHLVKRLNGVIPGMSEAIGKGDIEILFVNDGSTDGSREIMEEAAKNDSAYRYIHLSRNFGHQAAVSAGVRYARGQAVVVIDADLQDPPELIKDMVIKWKQGFDVVYAVRRKREGSKFKKACYRLFYILISLIADYPVQKDSGDFSLIDRKVINIINELPEKSPYMRGLRAWVGFKQVELPYDRPDREHGKTKYSMFSLFNLASQGILSTSVKPLFLSGIFSLTSIMVIAAIALYALIGKIFISEEIMPKGWTSIVVIVAIMGGFQLISTWLLSLYIARIYREILSRPTFIIESDSLYKE